MATVFKDGTVYYDTQEIGGDVNEITVNLATAALPRLTLADAGVQGVDAGGMSGSIRLRGFEGGEPEHSFRTNLATRKPLLASATRPLADGNDAALMQALGHMIDDPGVVAQLNEFMAEFAMHQAGGWGTVLKVGAGITSSGNGTEYNVGTVAAGAKRAFAGLWCYAASGGTLDVTIESDATGFASPTTRFTFTQLSAAVGSEFLWLDGAVTDDYWRATWNPGVGTYSFVVAMGILP